MKAITADKSYEVLEIHLDSEALRPALEHSQTCLDWQSTLPVLMSVEQREPKGT